MRVIALHLHTASAWGACEPRQGNFTRNSYGKTTRVQRTVGASCQTGGRWRVGAIVLCVPFECSTRDISPHHPIACNPLCFAPQTFLPFRTTVTFHSWQTYKRFFNVHLFSLGDRFYSARRLFGEPKFSKYARHFVNCYFTCAGRVVKTQLLGDVEKNLKYKVCSNFIDN